jgi:hypothetical protein
MRSVSELIYETCKTYLLTQGRFLFVLWLFIGAIIFVYFAFLQEFSWLQPEFVAEQLGTRLVNTGGGRGNQPVAPGLHGNGLGTVTLGGVALVPGASATVPLSDDLSFEVQVVNQGENNETDVNVRVTVGEGNDATELEEAIPEIAIGEQQTVTIPLAERPPTGENVPVTVEVEPVPGEEMTDNNTAEFTVIFTS